MVHKLEKLELATRYRQQGFSYSEIAKIVGVSKGTVSNWLAKKAFSKRVRVENTARAGRANAKRLGLLNKAKAKERDKRYQAALKTAKVEYRHYRANSLFTAGLALYIASGGKTSNGVIRLSSRDPAVHRIFYKFATQFLGADRAQVRFWLLLYPTHSETVCMREWSKLAKVHATQWYKNQFVESRSSKPTLHFGVGNTIIGDTVLKQKLDLWIELAKKELQK